MAETLQACRSFWLGAWRRRRLALATAWVICAAGWISVMVLPRPDQASVVVATTADDVRGLLLTPARLEQAARLSGLPLVGRQQVSELAEHLGERISIEPGGSFTYRISITVDGRGMASRLLRALLAAGEFDPASAEFGGAGEGTAAGPDEEASDARRQHPAPLDEVARLQGELAAARATQADLVGRLSGMSAAVGADAATDREVDAAGVRVQGQLSIELVRQEARITELESRLSAAAGFAQSSAQASDPTQSVSDSAGGQGKASGARSRRNAADASVPRLAGTSPGLRVVAWSDAPAASPRRSALLTAVLVLGLGSGAGLAGLAARRDGVFDTTWQLQGQLAVPVLGAVPAIALRRGLAAGERVFAWSSVALFVTLGALLIADRLASATPPSDGWSSGLGGTPWF